MIFFEKCVGALAWFSEKAVFAKCLEICMVRKFFRWYRSFGEAWRELAHLGGSWVRKKDARVMGSEFTDGLFKAISGQLQAGSLLNLDYQSADNSEHEEAVLNGSSHDQGKISFMPRWLAVCFCIAFQLQCSHPASLCCNWTALSTSALSSNLGNLCVIGWISTRACVARSRIRLLKASFQSLLISCPTDISGMLGIGYSHIVFILHSQLVSAWHRTFGVHCSLFASSAVLKRL